MTQAPLILTNRQHRECHERWLRWKVDFQDRIGLVKRLFDLAESSVRAFGPHLDDVWFLDQARLHEEVYGRFDPVDTLLDAMHFPANSEIVQRPKYIEQVKSLIREHEDYGSDGCYMPRSVILGWIAREHDALLGDINEAA